MKFAARTVINGFIVTEDNGSPLDDCQILFAGTVNATGVESLPDTPEFQAVKEHTGSFLLAPGFSVTFAGGFETINGSIAADQFDFQGNSTGMIKGSVITLADLPTTVTGQGAIYVDRSDMDQNPAGILKPLALSPLPRTYRELIGS